MNLYFVVSPQDPNIRDKCKTLKEAEAKARAYAERYQGEFVVKDLRGVIWNNFGRDNP